MNLRVLIVSPIQPAPALDATSLGESRFFDIPDFVLGIGNYSIVAQGFSAGDPNGNAGISGTPPTIDTGGGLISFVGSARFLGGGFQYPTILDSGPANRYDAGTFIFERASVPEPTTLALFGAGLAGLGALRRLRKAKA